MLRKVVINSCFGGFSLSPEAEQWIHDRDPSLIKAVPVREYFGARADDDDSVIGLRRNLERWREYKAGNRHGFLVHTFTADESCVLTEARELPRDHPLLIECVQTMGKQANGPFASLKIVEIPFDVAWVVGEYDGNEHIAEAHRTWP